MGKYMRERKAAADPAAAAAQREVETRARARMLAAAQKIVAEAEEKAKAEAAGNAGAEAEGEASWDSLLPAAYLELRSRRLQRPVVLPARIRSRVEKEEAALGKGKEEEPSPASVCSFGENVLEGESKDRNDRETTPCSVVMKTETIQAPGSSTRPTRSSAGAPGFRRTISSADEMDKYFTAAAIAQQQEFMQKYNFDVVKEEPLPGRYEWVRMDSRMDSC